MDKIDVIELGRGYLGAFLLFLDGWNGWVVTNWLHSQWLALDLFLGKLLGIY